MTTKTVRTVSSEPRMWESNYGPMASLTVTFTDGSKGQLNFKPEKVAERVETLSGLVGKDVTVEDGGKFEDGNAKPFKITDYPGKPQPQQKGSGGGRGFTPDPLRYAVESATSIAQTAYRIPDGATEGRDLIDAENAASMMLAFVEKAAPRILKAIQGEVGTQHLEAGQGLSPKGDTDRVQLPEAPRPAAPTEDPTERSDRSTGVETSESPSISTPGAPKPKNECEKAGRHLGPFTPPPNKAAADRGVVECGTCHLAGQWEQAEVSV